MKIKITIGEKRTRNREIRLQVKWEMISSCSYIYENAEDNTGHIQIFWNWNGNANNKSNITVKS